VELPSLHVTGSKDSLVTTEESRALAELFAEADVLEHGGGHEVPSKAKELCVIQTFIEEHANVVKASGKVRAPPAKKKMPLNKKKAAEEQEEGSKDKDLGNQDDNEVDAEEVLVEKEEFSQGTEAQPAILNLPGPVDEAHLEEQNDEVEALMAIFPEEVEVTSQGTLTSPWILSVSLSEWLGPACGLKVTIRFPPEYPDIKAVLRLENGYKLPRGAGNLLTDAMEEAAEEGLGNASAYGIVSAGNMWLENYVEEHVEVEVEAEEEDSTEALFGAKASSSEIDETWGAGEKGRWKYVIGLVGKPSAGKSTFFNAATQPLEGEEGMAKMAAHPFTTIDPNIGTAFYSISEVAEKFNIEDPGSEFGRTSGGLRRIPVMLKDVAGLVPGAWQGRGKGNRFLNDLVDADVLVHVVDASGRSDREGNIVEVVGDEGIAEERLGEEEKAPLGAKGIIDEITWVRHEIHQWIHGNIMAKWETICRRPQKLIDMFTGYHASRSLICNVLSKMGVNPSDIAATNLKNWTDEQINSLISQFLLARFPILIALNKADVPGAEVHMAEALSHIGEGGAATPVSAMLEWNLLQLRNAGKITYEDGAAEANCTDEIALSESEKEQFDAARLMLDRHGGTGVMQALNKAVALRPPIYAYPVDKLDTCMVAKSRMAGAETGTKNRITTNGESESGVLRDAVALKPQSTVGDLYDVLKWPPYSMIDGEFVRAECRFTSGRTQQIKKDDLIGEDNCIIKIQCNRKVSWQPQKAAEPSITKVKKVKKTAS